MNLLIPSGAPTRAAVAGLLLTIAIAMSACSQPGSAAPDTGTPASASNPATTSASRTSPSNPAIVSAAPAPSAPVLPAPLPPINTLPAETGPAETGPAGTGLPTAPAPSAAGTIPTAGFQSTISVIDATTAARMATSWRPGCPVALADLRYLAVTYRGFDGVDHNGELVVAAAVADDVVDIFRALYDSGYPIQSLQLVDDFGGSDEDSMAADNSSAFNCRPVTGGGGFSEHSYGTAIDLNPVQNPYLSDSSVLPDAGRPFVDRHPAPGVIEPGDAVVTAFAEHGWSWGGWWSGPVDYQHFSVSGR